MARVIGPLMSLSASGTLAGTLTFQCGSVIKKKIGEDKDPPLYADLNFQQKLFRMAAHIWKTELSQTTKDLWKKAAVVSALKPICLLVPGAMIVSAFVNPVGGAIFSTRVLAILLGLFYAKDTIAIQGYPLWVSVYLITKGQHWEGYPNPPPEAWKPFN